MTGITDKPVVLIVDDVPDNIDLIRNVIADDYEIRAAANGASALKIALSQELDAIILDVMMPEMDGFEVCRRLKENELTARIPIIFVTALDSRDDIQRGLELGGFHYLLKPVIPEKLKAVVANATEHFNLYKTLRDENSRLMGSLDLMKEGVFHFHSLNEARNLAVLVAKSCPNAEQRLLGLTELMINAVEHGNLGITYDEKGVFVEQGAWENEVERRLGLPENIGKYATLHLMNENGEICITITDQGEGFDWQNYMKVDPGRAFDNHGRGIALANAISFDQLEYQGNGSSVLAKITKQA